MLGLTGKLQDFSDNRPRMFVINDSVIHQVRGINVRETRRIKATSLYVSLIMAL